MQRVVWKWNEDGLVKEFGENESSLIEERFQKLLAGGPESLQLKVNERSTIFFSRCEVELKEEGAIKSKVFRVFRHLPEQSIVKYGTNEAKDEVLCGRWLWWVGTWKQYYQHKQEPDNKEVLLWVGYSVDECLKLDQAYNTGGKPEDFQINGMYSANLKEMVQYQTNNPHKKRPICRVTIGWFWDSTTRTDVPPGVVEKPEMYAPEECLILEEAYCKGKMNCEILAKNNSNYRVNFIEMCQFPLTNRLQRRNVLRKGPTLLDAECVIWKDQAFSWAETEEKYPPYWTPKTNTTIERVEVAPHDQIFQRMSVLMNSTIGEKGHKHKFGLVAGVGKDPKRFEVVRVVQIQNYSLWEAYTKKKIELRKDYPQHSVENEPNSQYLRAEPMKVTLLDKTCNEYYMFHGTSEHVIEEFICSLGLNPRANKHGMFGRGVYFAENSSKSNQYVPCSSCGHGCINYQTPCNCSSNQNQKPHAMLVCRVTLGHPYICVNYDEDLSYMKNPLNDPDFALTHRDGQQYHSVFVESKDKGGSRLVYREAVVYDRLQCYPEFIVYYHRHAH